MAMLFGATLFFGITTAFCVPYLYAYCTQASDVTVQESDATKEEEESENRENELVHSLRVKEKGSNSLELRKTKMKDATVNTIETMASDTTSYKKLPSIKENSQEELNEAFQSACTEKSSTSIHSNDSSSFRGKRTRGPMQVQALVHAQNFMPNSETFIKETLKKRNLVQTAFDNVNKNHLLKKKQFFQKETTSGRWKKFWTGVRSRGSSKPSSSEDSSQTNVPLSSVTSGSSSNQGTRSNTGISLENNTSPTLKLQSQPPVGHSTLRESKQKLALMFHEVNGPPSIHIESPSGSNTSLTISVGDLLPTRISQSKSTTFLIEVQQTVASSDQDTDLNDKFCLNRLYNSLPGRLRSTGIEVKENLRRSSSTF